MDKLLAILCFITAVAMMIMAFPEGLAAAVVVLVTSLVVIVIINFKIVEEKEYLLQLFLLALLARLVFGLFIHILELRSFFGNDSTLYDMVGNRLSEIWFGHLTVPNDSITARARMTSGSGWGMYYLVAFIYSIVGRNILAAQAFCGVIGAATVPMIYLCAKRIFNNRDVAKISALLVALYPAFIIWSGQLLKDGLIIFLLVLAMTMVLNLQEKFSYSAVLLLLFSLFSILTLRFYIFYMAAAAVIGAFVVGKGNTPQAIVRRLGVLLIIGVGFTYLGVIQNAGSEIGEYANLQRIQRSRQDLAVSAESGYGEDFDVSTTEGAISALPVGFTYLMLAPFPWEMTNLRQLITLPEVLLWWMSFPFLISGLIFTIRKNLRGSIAILLFSLMLTLAYSIFLGNVGTAYRQRTQIQVFLFIFIAVGFTLYKERRENKKLLIQAKNREIEKRLRANLEK